MNRSPAPSALQLTQQSLHGPPAAVNAVHICSTSDRSVREWDRKRREAVRRPGLARILGDTLRRGFRDDVAFHAASGLPGGAFEVALLHYAVDGLLLDLLTISIDAGFDPDEVVSALVARLVAGGAAAARR